ncbi:hypothetical protein FQR65_LT17411 [Abscondita terminalis]|nr:hypothetical protein FQR65_LT17411 [Abscondita terminalis]
MFRINMSFSILKRSFSTSSSLNLIKNITVLGGGLMGSGIAQVAAQTGHNVTLVDLNSDILKNPRDKPEDAEKFVRDSKNCLNTSTDAVASVKDADLVIEAVAENMDIKHKVFKSIDEAAPAKTIFVSNTSSFSIAEIGSVTKRGDRFGGMHFFSPVPVMKLVEVIKTSTTSEETVKELLSCGKAMGKVCITCKDTPGFVVNRLLVPYVNEAVKLLERGDASAEDIDIAMKLGTGYPMGPIELADFTGHDISLAVLEGWHKRFPDNPLFEPTETLRKLVREGKLGRKTGEGFYKYK